MEEAARLTEQEQPAASLTARFLGNEPDALVGDVLNAVNDYICDSADSLEDFLASDQSGIGKEKEKEVVAKEVANRVYDCLRGSFNKNFKLFETFVLKNVLHVPHDLHVPELQSPKAVKKHTEEEIAQLDAELDTLRKRLVGARHLRQAMNAELESLGSDDFRRLKEFAENLRPLNRPLPESGQTLEEGIKKLAAESMELREFQARIDPALRELINGRAGASSGSKRKDLDEGRSPEERYKRRREELQTATNVGEDLAKLRGHLIGAR
eukprot:tig00020710_g13267.t1